ncbi:uncharacterized protein LOC135400110 [Ornithodoros turicata]|uniref:uncharacterized protein LOC135400110 n=1 Tax=Ornithodoros turicata TaxID=34597 RepID=UPI0031397E4C
MKVVISSLVLLALLQLATCDCGTASSSAAAAAFQKCVEDIEVNGPFRSINFDAVSTEAHKENVLCCGVKYIKDCVDTHIGTVCPSLVAGANARARESFLEAANSDVTCQGALPTNCDSLPSLFSL